MTEEEILAFKAGHLEVQCRSIELVQRDVESPRQIIAPGRIYQEVDGSLRLVAYPDEVSCVRRPNLPLGTAFPEDHYWNLRAVDRHGRHWVTERVLLHVDEPGFPLWRPLEEPLWSVRREETLTQPYKRSHFTGYIFRHLDICPNAKTSHTMTRPNFSSKGGTLNIMRFPIEDLQVDIRQEKEHTVVDVSTDGPFPARFEQRLLEAVRFVFGRPVSWSATVQGSGTREITYLRGRPVQDQATHFGQLVRHNIVGADEHMAELLRRYYLHVVQDTEGKWHPLSIWWSEVLRAGSREMESLVLIAAVGVEGVCRAIIDANEMPPGVETIPKDTATAWRAKIAEELARLGCPDRIMRRVDGLFPKMSQVAAVDVLTALQRLNAVDKNLVKLWRDARPDAAHGTGERWSSAERITRDADGMVTLLRQVTLWWIGYRGWYTILDPDGWRQGAYNPIEQVPAG